MKTTQFLAMIQIERNFSIWIIRLRFLPTVSRLRSMRENEFLCRIPCTYSVVPNRRPTSAN